MIVITGAGSGFGRSLAEMTAAMGARILTCDVDGDAATATADAITGAGGEAVPCEPTSPTAPTSTPPCAPPSTSGPVSTCW